MRKQGIYPELWKSGRCPIRHRLWLECQRNRAQCKYRGQQFEITEEQFIELWMKDDRYKRRGKGATDLCMTRKDKQLPWRVDNVYFPTRREHFQGLYTGTTRKTYINEGKC